MSEDVIIPIAAFMLMIVLVTDLIQTLINGNQFQDAEIGTFVKWFLKAFVGLMIVSNVYVIATGIFTFGAYAGAGGINNIKGVMSTLSYGGVFSGGDLPFLVLMLIMCVITLICMVVLFVAIVVTLAGRVLEVFMYLAISPIPAATFMNAEWKSIGYSAHVKPRRVCSV
jgi:hypothetical protein